MAGGGALLRGIDRLVAKETQLPVTIAEDPLISVANGAGKVLQNIDYWRNAPVWDEKSISEATQSWFKYLDDPVP